MQKKYNQPGMPASTQYEMFCLMHLWENAWTGTPLAVISSFINPPSPPHTVTHTVWIPSIHLPSVARATEDVVKES